MRGQNRRLVQEAIKSPSPDIANRSIIANTKSPANEIREYMRMRESSTSPKSMATSFHQISKANSSQNEQLNRLKRQIQQLQSRMVFYERIKVSHDQLHKLNQQLRNQVSQLKLELAKKRERTHSNNSRNVSPMNSRPISPKANGQKGVSLSHHLIPNAHSQDTSPSIQNDSILREFNERIVRMSDQNKRLMKKLKEIKDQKDSVESQNLRLKQIQRTPRSQNYDIQNLKRYFYDETERISKRCEQTTSEKISQVNARWQKVEEAMSKIVQMSNKNKGFPRTNSVHQQKGNVSFDTTNFKSQEIDQERTFSVTNQLPMIESKYTVSPSQVRAFTIDASPIRDLEEEKDRIKHDNERLTKRVQDLQNLLKESLMGQNQLEKRLKELERERSHSKIGTHESLKFLEEKCEALEKQLRGKKAAVVNQESEISFLKQKIQEREFQIQDLKKRLQESGRLQNDQVESYNRIIKQHKEKIANHEDQIHILNQRIKQVEAKYTNLLEERNIFLKMQNELRDLELKYNETKADFDKYLGMVIEIRQSITGEQVETCLNELEAKWWGYDELALEILKIHECYQINIQNLKKTILDKEMNIAELQRQNQILSETNRQIEFQLEKLRRAIDQQKEPIKANFSEEELKKRLQIHRSASKSREGCQIREYINRTVSKISNLQNEIDGAIKSHQKGQRANLGYNVEKNGLNRGSYSPLMDKMGQKRTNSIRNYQEQLEDPQLFSHRDSSYEEE